MRLKLSICILLLILFIGDVYAQKEVTPTRIIYAELFGKSDIYSLNFEYVFKTHHSARLGFAWLPGTWQLSGENDRAFFYLPLEYNYIIGKSNHKLDISVGILTTLTWYNDYPNNYKLTPQTGIGYRYQREKKGLFFRSGVALNIPLFLSADKNESFFYTGQHWLFWPQLAVGWSF